MSVDSLDFVTALYHHLKYNHYPAVDTAIIPECTLAIKAVADDCPTCSIPIPSGPTLTAEEIVEDLHLWDFVEFLKADKEK